MPTTPIRTARRTLWRTAIFSGIVYLDDYRGGELYFTVRNTPIAPQKRMLLAFTTGF